MHSVCTLKQWTLNELNNYPTKYKKKTCIINVLKAPIIINVLVMFNCTKLTQQL